MATKNDILDETGLNKFMEWCVARSVGAKKNREVQFVKRYRYARKCEEQDPSTCFSCSASRSCTSHCVIEYNYCTTALCFLELIMTAHHTFATPCYSLELIRRSHHTIVMHSRVVFFNLFSGWWPAGRKTRVATRTKDSHFSVEHIAI